MKQKMRCANPACGRLFSPNPRIKNQRYCSAKACQLARKREWQREKMKNDPDYRLNQKAAQQHWRENHRDYPRRYRELRPESVQHNRLKQRERDRQRRLDDLAKMDASDGQFTIKTGSYYLIPAEADLGKKDASWPKFWVIPEGYALLAKKDSMDPLAGPDLDCLPRQEGVPDPQGNPAKAARDALRSSSP